MMTDDTQTPTGEETPKPVNETGPAPDNEEATKSPHDETSAGSEPEPAPSDDHPSEPVAAEGADKAEPAPEPVIEALTSTEDPEPGRPVAEAAPEIPAQPEVDQPSNESQATDHGLEPASSMEVTADEKAADRAAPEAESP